MPQAIQSLTSLLPALQTGTQLASAGSNIYQGYENQKYQDMLRGYAENPQKLQQYEQGFVQPLNAGLEKGVANQAQAYAAERGLSQSPGPQSEIIAQAIAPYEQQNQQQGYQNALAALGLGGGAQPTNTQAGLTSLFSGLGGLNKLGGQLNLSNVEQMSRDAGGASPQAPGLTYTIPQADPGMQDFYAQNGGY